MIPIGREKVIILMVALNHFCATRYTTHFSCVLSSRLYNNPCKGWTSLSLFPVKETKAQAAKQISHRCKDLSQDPGGVSPRQVTCREREMVPCSWSQCPTAVLGGARWECGLGQGPVP